MKNLTKLMAMLLVMVTAFSLVACSSKYGALKKAFEKEGYAEYEDLEYWNKKFAEETNAENGELAFTLHAFYKKSDVPSTGTIVGTFLKQLIEKKVVLVLEFKATKDMLEFYKESNTMQGVVKDIKENEDAQEFYKALVEAGYANGNCLVFTIGLENNSVKEIVKKA